MKSTGVRGQNEPSYVSTSGPRDHAELDLSITTIITLRMARVEPRENDETLRYFTAVSSVVNVTAIGSC